MSMTNYPGGFAGGISVRGLPLLQTYPGKMLYVGNSSVVTAGRKAGSNTNKGTFNAPFATLEYALSQAQASAGDVIMVLPGHAETISTAAILTLDKAGVAIIGMGFGSLRPTFTFTAAAANIPVTAANIAIQNCVFVANFADVASFFTVTGTALATDLAIERCEFRDTSSILNALTILTGNATANCLDGLVFCQNRISSRGTTAATTAIKISAAQDRWTINENFGNWAVLNDTAAMLAAGANNITNFEFGWNVLNRPSTSSTGGLFISGSGTTWTGHCHDNRLWGLDNSAQIWIATGTKLAFNENYCPITAAADRNGLINPAAV